MENDEDKNDENNKRILSVTYEEFFINGIQISTDEKQTELYLVQDGYKFSN